MAVNQEIKIVFTVDDSALEDAKKSTVDLGNAVEADKKKYKELATVIEQDVANELKAAGAAATDFSKKVQDSSKQAGSSVKSLRTELKEAKQAALEAARNFGEGSKEFAAAAKRAGELKAQLGDLNQTLGALDPDTKAKAFTDLGNTVFGAFQVATGSLQAFGVESERVNKLAEQFQGLINITQGLSQLGQLQDSLKNVATVLGITSSAQKAAAAATATTTVALEAETVATTGATVATKGLTTALLTSPFVIIAAAVAALAGAVYLYNKANDEAIEKQEKLKQQQEGLLKLNQELTKAYNRGVERAAENIQFQIDLAAAQGKAQDVLIAKEIEKQKVLERGFQFIIDSGKADKEQLREATDNRDRARREQQVLAAELTKFLFDENIKRGEDEKKAREKAAREAEQAIKDEQDRQAKLREQFEKELSTQLGDADAQLNIQKTINATKFFDKEKELKIADVAAEIQANDQKIAILEQFGQTYTREYEQLLAKRNLLNKQYDAAQNAAQETQLQKWLGKNQDALEAAVETAAQFAAAITELTAQNTEERIDAINAEFEADREGTQQLLDDKRISQKEYDDSITQLEKRRDNEIKKLQREQATREKALAIFNALIASSLAILQVLATPNLDPVTRAILLATTAAQGAIQIAFIAATPIPKFAKGTLSVGGGQEGTDSVHAMLMPGEAVIPTRVNRKYKEPIKAIFHESVGADELTQFIQMTPNMRYALLMAAGEQFNDTIVNKPTNISTAQIMNSYISQAVKGNSISTRSSSSRSVNVDMSGVERSIRNNKSVRLDNTKQLAEQIASSITDSINIRRKW